MSPQDKQALKLAAEAATPGLWEWGGTPVATTDEAVAICVANIEATAKPGTHFCEVYLADGRRTALVGNGPTSIANAAFIAAANPTVILDLLAENERLAAENMSYRNYIASAPDWGGVDHD